MTSAQQAHLRLMATLRERTRTHECRLVMKQRGSRYADYEKEALREELLRLQARGVPRKQMARECGTSNKTIRRLIGRAERRCK
jgi:DNA invertase Pin-like site-specific DNA recombinase